MTVLVTGGAGYIGSHTVHALVDAGERVVVLDNLSTGFATALPKPMLPIVGDVGDQALVAELIEDHEVEAIIHFAGSTIVPESMKDPLGYYGNNTANSRALIEAAVKGGVRHFIFSSTAAVYGNPARVPVAEDDPTVPLSPYGWSKLMTEVMLRDASAAHGLAPRGAALLQRRRRRPADAHRPVDARRHASHQGRGRGRARPPRADRRVRHRLSDPGRHLHPRLHPCQRSRARASRGAALSARAAAPAPRSIAATAAAIRCARCWTRSAARSGIAFAVNFGERRPGDIVVSVAAANRIRELLNWTPELDDLDTIVGHALAWERHLMTQADPQVRAGRFRPDFQARIGAAGDFSLKKPGATGKERASGSSAGQPAARPSVAMRR